MNRMKCTNCGGTEFEKADWEGTFSLPYKDKNDLSIDVLKYFYDCIGCGYVQQVVHVDERKRILKENLDSFIENKFIPRRERKGVERIRVIEISSATKIPYDMLVPLLEDLLNLHPAYSERAKRVIPILSEDNGELFVKKKS